MLQNSPRNFVTVTCPGSQVCKGHVSAQPGQATEGGNSVEQQGLLTECGHIICGEVGTASEMSSQKGRESSALVAWPSPACSVKPVLPSYSHGE